MLNFYCLAAALQLFPLVLDLLSGAGVSCARCTLIATYNSHQISLTCSGWIDLPLFNDERHGTSGTSKCSRPLFVLSFLASPVTFDFQMQKTTELHPKYAILVFLPAHRCTFKEENSFQLSGLKTDIYFCTLYCNSCIHPFIRRETVGSFTNKQLPSYAAILIPKSRKVNSLNTGLLAQSRPSKH